MKARYFILLTSLFFLLNSCEDKLFSDSETDKELVFLPLICRVADETPADPTHITRASGTIDTKKVDNIWIFQFDGTEVSSVLLTNPQYIEASVDGSLSAGVIPSATNARLLFVANTNRSAINWKAVKGVTTYQDILNISGEYYREGDVTGLENRNIVMSGIIDGVISLGATLKPDLYRSLARVELKLEVASDCKYKVVSSRLCNIPSNICWTDYLKWKDTPNEDSPSVLSTLFQTYANAVVAPFGAGEEQTLTWYMPRNARGTITNSEQKTKNEIAPGKASYIEVYAVNKDKENEGRYYRIFPGANLTNDFNILSNTSYNLSFRITDGTEGEDARVADVKDVEFAELANCYILNPPSFGSAPLAYSIPVVGRVNQFFNNYAYNTINKENGIFKGFQNASDTWTCRVIWCDNANLISFGNYTTESIDRLYLASSSGDGANKQPIKIVVPPLNKEQYGNLCFGIYDKKGVCRWSWHLWITDYNPNVSISVDPLKFTYSVPGGQVDRYACIPFGYRTPSGNETTLTPLFKKVYEAGSNNFDYCYNRSYLMDRNLGATSAYGMLPEYGGCYYQYGRKEPFQFRKTLYDGTGKKLQAAASRNWYQIENAITNSNYVKTMSDAIAAPTSFYQSSNSWMGTIAATSTPFEGTGILYIWHDPTLPTSGVGVSRWNNVKKSLFDPCPPGWQVPHMANNRASFFSDFSNSRTTYTLIEFGDNPYNERGFYYYSLLGNGCYYWPEIKKEADKLAPVEGIIFTPATGYVTMSKGALEYDGEDGWQYHSIYLRGNSSNGAKSSVYMGDQSRTPASYNTDKAVGAPVRCIKSPEIPAGQ